MRKHFNFSEHEKKEAHESEFYGENCLHVAIINRREALVCRMPACQKQPRRASCGGASGLLRGQGAT